MVLGAVEAWIVPNTRCPVSAAWIAVSKRLPVAHLAHQHHVGVLADRVLHADPEVLHVHADLALVDQTLVVGEGELDRVLQGEDVLAVAVVDVVEHRGDGGALARAGDARQKDHPLGELAQPGQHGREKEVLEVGDDVVHPPRDQPHLAQLLQDVHAEPPALAFQLQRMGEVHAAVFVEDPLPPLLQLEHREDQPHHLLGVDRVAVQRPQRAVDADKRRTTDLQVQIASLELHQGPEKLVDFQFLLLAEEALLIVSGGGHGRD